MSVRQHIREVKTVGRSSRRLSSNLLYAPGGGGGGGWSLGGWNKVSMIIVDILKEC